MARHRAGKELVVDPSLALGARRNIPVRYNRNLVASVLRAIPRINEIKAKRERAFYKSRMQGNKEKQRQANRKLVDENQHLLPPAMRNTTRELVECEDFDMETEAMESNRAEDMFNERKKLEEMKGKEKLRLIVD
jgi:large subunit ribosomal protein L24e